MAATASPYGFPRWKRQCPPIRNRGCTSASTRPTRPPRKRFTPPRIPPGKGSVAYQPHLVEGEWVYILAGRGLADIDGKQYEVGPGDFMGFPAPGIAHLLRNPFDEALVYLMGGEAVPLDVLDYPTL